MSKPLTQRQKRLRSVRAKRDYIKNKEARNATVRDAWRRGRATNPIGELLKLAKLRAAKNGLAFDIAVEDIDKPEFCPVLGLQLDYGTTGYRQTALPH